MQVYLKAVVVLLFVALGASAVETDSGNGTIWAVLVSGSYEYENYRHQVQLFPNYQHLIVSYYLYVAIMFNRLVYDMLNVK